MVTLIGSKETAQQVKDTTIRLFKLCRDYALENFGFEIADGKVEYGFIDGVLSLVDETFTSDSARFIPDKSKEVFRKWLTDHNLRKVAAVLPDEVAMMVSDLYRSQCLDMKIKL